MATIATPLHADAAQPVVLQLDPALSNRNRLTTGFRILLAIPHLLLVGGPMGAGLTWAWSESGVLRDGGAGGGVLGLAAGVAALIAWFAILATGRHPEGLWNLAAYYLRWRVRAVAYAALLRDEYPPFGEGSYPVGVELSPPAHPRDRLTVAFRVILVLPHLLAVWALSLAWALATAVAWVAILFTGRYPEELYHFGVGVLRWNTRVEAYLLLLHDRYPPFSLD